jgi:hypothetical protein
MFSLNTVSVRLVHHRARPHTRPAPASPVPSAPPGHRWGRRGHPSNSSAPMASSRARQRFDPIFITNVTDRDGKGRLPGHPAALRAHPRRREAYGLTTMLGWWARHGRARQHRTPAPAGPAPPTTARRLVRRLHMTSCRRVGGLRLRRSWARGRPGARRRAHLERASCARPSGAAGALPDPSGLRVASAGVARRTTTRISKPHATPAPVERDAPTARRHPPCRRPGRATRTSGQLGRRRRRPAGSSRRRSGRLLGRGQRPQMRQ